MLLAKHFSVNFSTEVQINISDKKCRRGISSRWNFSIFLFQTLLYIFQNVATTFVVDVVVVVAAAVVVDDDLRSFFELAFVSL